MNLPKISFIINCQQDLKSLERFLGSLVREIKNIPYEIILLNNQAGIKLNQLKRKPGIEIVKVQEDKMAKPQDILQKSTKLARGKLIILHSSRDEILPGYEKLLIQSIDKINKKGIFKLPRKIKTESELFAKRPILYGHCFSRKILDNAFPFDFMFRQNFHKTALEPKVRKPVFTYEDIPLWQSYPSSKVSLILTIKNRLEHWQKIMPSLVAQENVNYELLFVDYFSEDKFPSRFQEYIFDQQKNFSPHLKQITMVRLKENKKFSSCKAKNLGARNTREASKYLAFSDIDTFLREDYLAYWVSKIEKMGRAFVVCRAKLDRRLSPEVNYGNMIVPKNLYFQVKGHNENIKGFGGDDDELFNRLLNTGAKEINPRTPEEARQYSILHGAEERLKYLEIPSLSGLQDWKFLNFKGTTWSKNDNWGKQEAVVMRFKGRHSLII